jgi:hypothetical protein
VAEDSGLRIIPFASLLANDSTGPANESGQTLTITGFSGATGGSVSISGTDVLFTPADNFNGSASFTYIVRDNGTTAGAPNPKTSSAVVNFSITEVNDAPAGADNVLPNIAEDSGTRTIAFAALLANDSKGPANESGQTLAITNVSAAVGGTVSIVGSEVLFVPTSNYSGPASFTYALRDDGKTNGSVDFKTSAATVTFTIDAVNDPPSFVAAIVPPANDESGPLSIPFASSIVAGPPRESTQQLEFKILSNTNKSLFAALPSIDAAGVLTFTPNFNVAGQTTITVVLEDNGGIASGGINSSQPLTFNIDIAKARVWHNAKRSFDVTGEGNINASDALAVINFINSFGPQAVPHNNSPAAPFLDTTGEGNVNASDALAVINFINSFGPQTGSGESPSGRPQSESLAETDLLMLLATDIAAHQKRRLK